MPRRDVKVRKTPQTNVIDLEVCRWGDEVRVQGLVVVYNDFGTINPDYFIHGGSHIRLCGVTNLRRLHDAIGRVLREVE